MPRPLEVFLRFLRLGLTAFGGPVAHLGYFRREFVERARWLDDAAFTELVALCSVLPGPTSSQVGMLLGAKRAGPFGALAAWFAFTFPSALVLAIVAWLGRADFQAGQRGIAAVAANPNVSIALGGAVTGLIFTAYAVVLLAVVTLARAIVVTRFANVFVCAAFAVSLAALTYAPAFSWIALALGALAGSLYAPRASIAKSATLIRVSRDVGIGAFVLLTGTLAALFALPADGYGNIFATTFRAGSLVFGGGHVVLGFLTPFVSDRGVTLSQFQAGYGVTQAMPGPLFTFASFLGAADPSAPNAFVGALAGTIGIFLPSFLILPAALALWTIVREAPRAGAVLAGLNVAVVGLLAATFVDLVRAGILHGGLRSPIVGAIICIIAFALLTRAKWPAWAVVLSMAFGGAAYALAAATLQFPYVLRLG